MTVSRRLCFDQGGWGGPGQWQDFCGRPQALADQTFSLIRMAVRQPARITADSKA